MSAPQSEPFKKAVTDSKKLTSKPSNEDLLELYGTPAHRIPEALAPALYKIGTGEDIDKAPAPGMFDLKARSPISAGKAKKNAWQKVVDEDITYEQAQERYVALVERMKVTYGYDENREPATVGS
ncbi:Acyl-CoA-binding protein 1 [Tolypocladium capitatum]|uniref:Acyl-CoA-binding protein 1 n=1 Tax=Tolypocladium capitatum TaxID=45235 RepID=A0A2K3Q883_9HYPO|nr:Acyl-CoA-binding protein 1 [Tolypocladium capitatum]